MAVSKKRKNLITNIILSLVFLAGLSAFAYPIISSYVNSLSQSKAIVDYIDNLGDVSAEQIEAELKEAELYNRKLAGEDIADVKAYDDIINPTGNGMMGYVEIEKLAVDLPIYHGTSEPVLQVGVGHYDTSSFPVGGASTHCVLMGHRGLPSSDLFTNLDKLQKGDTFVLNILKSQYTYKVIDIFTVLPTETDELQIVNNEDYCTLVTCTPYGINSHRLLIRGERTENAEVSSFSPTTNMLHKYIKLILAIVIVLLIILVFFFVILRKRKVGKKDVVKTQTI